MVRSFITFTFRCLQPSCAPECVMLWFGAEVSDRRTKLITVVSVAFFCSIFYDLLSAVYLCSVLIMDNRRFFCGSVM